MRCRVYPRGKPRFRRSPVHRSAVDEPCAICGSTHSYLDEVVLDTPETACLSAPIPIIAANRASEKPMNQPLLSVNNLTHLYARAKALAMSLLIYGRGKCWASRGIRLREDHAAEVDLRAPDAQQGEIRYENRSLYGMSEADPVACCAPNGAWCISIHSTACPPGVGRRQYRRAADGDRGASYGDIRATAQKWLEEVEIPATGSTTCRPPFPAVCSSVCRLPQPGDASEAGIYGRANRRAGVSVQARLLDLLRGLVVELNRRW